MQPQAQIQDQAQETNQPKLQVKIDFANGFKNMMGKPGILEWGADDRIRLFETDRDHSKVQTKVFDISIGEVQKVSSITTTMTIKLATGSYSIIFSRPGMLLVSSVGGMFVADHLNKNSGLDAYLEEFKKHGVGVTATTGLRMLKLSLIIGLVGFGFVVGFALLAVSLGWM